ncbi:MAG: PID-CTERM protein-sorting domain-containing protein [Bacteroidota bacterium]
MGRVNKNITCLNVGVICRQGLPGLPSEPEQISIDGGLGILAVLGGAYPIKKLRDKE